MTDLAGLIERLEDKRPLQVRLEAMARRYEAIATGTSKLLRRGAGSAQDMTNALRDAATIREALRALQASTGEGEG